MTHLREVSQVAVENLKRMALDVSGLSAGKRSDKGMWTDGDDMDLVEDGYHPDHQEILKKFGESVMVATTGGKILYAGL